MGKVDTFLFGYGSLMYPSGINGRGLRYRYQWDDLTPAILLGYKRGPFAHYINVYYGIMKSKRDIVSGVVFELHTDLDLERLLIDEGASEIYRDTEKGLMYEVEDVSEFMVPRFDGRVLTLINIADKHVLGKVPRGYIKRVYKGIQPWGKGFVDDFLDTGGIKPSGLLDGVISTYNIGAAPRRIAKRLLRSITHRKMKKEDKVDLSEFGII